MPPYHIALLFNANKIYDRQIISGIGQYIASTRVEWDLFIEEDFRGLAVGIEQWGGDGIIADYDDPQIAAALSKLSIPVVAVGGSYANEDRYPAGIPYVATDNFKLVRLAYDHLLERGLSHFALYSLQPLPGNRWAQEREDAFAAIARTERIQGVIHRGASISAGAWGQSQAELAEWVRSLPKPVGIICVTDARARQLLQACNAVKLAVPEQVAIVGIDNEPMAQVLSRTPLTSVIQGTEQMGRVAARTLHQHLCGERSATRVLLPPAGLNVQASSLYQAVHSPYVMRALHYLRQFAHTGIKAEQVALYVGVSRTALEERFKRELKKTVHQAILQHKLERALALLADESNSLVEVAAQSGFTTVQYMCSVFRREYQCTPGEMQQRSRGNGASGPVELPATAYVRPPGGARRPAERRRRRTGA